MTDIVLPGYFFNFQKFLQLTVHLGFSETSTTLQLITSIFRFFNVSDIPNPHYSFLRSYADFFNIPILKYSDQDKKEHTKVLSLNLFIKKINKEKSFIFISHQETKLYL